MIKIRNSIKAIIIKDNRILFNRMKSKANDEIFYILPGGGQEGGETFVEALNRECLEELGTEVTVGDLVLIREYIGKNHEFAEEHMEIHQIEYMFSCELIDDINESKITHYDYQQVGHTWIKLEELSESNVYPKILKEVIIKINSNINKPIYLGDVN